MWGWALRQMNTSSEKMTPATIPHSTPKAECYQKSKKKSEPVAGFHPEQVAGLGNLHQAGHGDDDNGGQDRRGEVVEELGEPEQDDADDQRCYQPGQTGSGTGPVVDGGSGKPAGDRIAGKERRCQVGNTQPQQFTVRVDPVFLFVGDEPGNSKGLKVADHGDGQACRQQGKQLFEGKTRNGKRWQAVGEIADSLDPGLVQVEQRRQQRAEDDNHEWPGNTGHQALQNKQQADGRPGPGTWSGDAFSPR